MKIKMLTILLILCVFVCGCSDERLSQPMEVMFFGTPHNLGYRSIPYAEGYWLRDRTIKHYDWGDIVLTLERRAECKRQLEVNLIETSSDRNIIR